MNKLLENGSYQKVKIDEELDEFMMNLKKKVEIYQSNPFFGVPTAELFK